MLRTSLPFELRLLARLGLPAWGVGVLCGIVALLVCFGLLKVTGEALLSFTVTGGPRLTGQSHVAVLVSLLFGYLVGVSLHFARASQSLVAGTDPEAPGTDGSGSTASLLAGAFGLLIGAMLIFLSARAIQIQEPARNVLSAGELAIDAVSLLLLWGIGRASVFTLRGSRPAQLRNLQIDLLDLARLFPIARTGLRAALAWIGGISLGAAVMAFDPNPALLVDAGWIIAAILCLSFALGSFALMAPLWQLHGRISEAKEHAIAATLHELRKLRERSSPPPGVEADLIARNAFLAGLSSWPVDIGTLRRFGFYVFFPVASWLGGSVLQRVVDTVLVSELVKLLLNLPR